MSCRPIFTFEIYLPSERAFLFGAETSQVQRKWTEAIAKVFIFLLIFYWSLVALGFPRSASGKQPACQCRRHETWLQSLGWEDPLEQGIEPTPVFLPGESHGQRSLAGYSPWGRKESDTTKVT